MQFKFKSQSSHTAYYQRDGVKQAMGIPLVHFGGDKAPPTFEMTLPEGFEFADPKKRQKATISAARILKGAPTEVKRKVQEARVAAERQALIDAGFDPDTGKKMDDSTGDTTETGSTTETGDTTKTPAEGGTLPADGGDAGM